jgi:thiamine biosynthesis protein ThiI
MTRAAREDGGQYITYLLKPGELSLKRGNKAVFIQILCRNLAAMIKGSGAWIDGREGRFFVHCPAGSAALVEDALSRLAGISGWARARVAEKEAAAVFAAVVEEARAAFSAGARSFKVESRRTDKSFPLSSYEINCAAGEAVCAELPGFTVDVRRPELVIRVEIREKAFVYGGEKPGLRGLPVGSAGRGMLLLSGGIDSPVAGFLMALRGLSLKAAHFHAWPWTAKEAEAKAASLAGILRRYSPGLKLFLIPFAEVGKRIKEGAPAPWMTVLLRMAMMDCASRLARYSRCVCLITGESLSQVASQTAWNIGCTESAATLPVLRPLIGMDKEDITRKALAIGTYQTSIEPYADCCALFTAEHPVLRADAREAARLYAGLELDAFLKSALDNFTTA